MWAATPRRRGVARDRNKRKEKGKIMNMTSTDTATIDHPVQRAVLYARWEQADWIPSRGAVYLRFNSMEQVERYYGGAECDEQLAMARGYAKNKGWDIVRDYRDIGTVDNPWDRPAFRQVMDIMRAGQAEVLVVSHLDRVARDARTIDTIVNDLSLIGGCLMATDSAFAYPPLQ